MDTKAPTIAKVQRIIERQRWHSNCPSAEAIMTKWVPPHKEEVESSATLMKLVRTQKWKYLAVVEPSPKAGVGKGVVTTKTFPKNGIICDYHGDIITGAEGRKRMAQKSDEMGYCFFFKAGAEDLCVDATENSCPCHPDMDTFGRLINHSKKKPNSPSTKIWTREGRVWDFNEICQWCPHVASRRALLRELRTRGFLIQNDTADSGTTEADDPSTSAAELPASPLASSSSPTEAPPSEDQPHSALETDPSWQRPTPQFTTRLRARMQQKNLYAKFSTDNPLLQEFKQHLSAVLQIPNYQQEVDNVSRVLRYIQPTGEDINLDFLDNTTVLGEYFEQLKKVGQSPATRINYIKSLIQFIKFLKLSRGATDLSIVQKCQHYQEFLTVLRKPISKSHSKDLCDKRHGYLLGPKTSVHKLRAVLREAKNDTLGIFGRFLSGEDVTEEEKTPVPLLLRGHPDLWPPSAAWSCRGADGGVTEWVQRQTINRRVVVAVKSHKTANSQVAPFALTEEEAALINQYYLSIRSDHVWDDSDSSDSERFFLAKNGKPINSATNDVRRLHEVYKCPNVTSQEIRRAAEMECSNLLTDEQKNGLAYYLASTATQAHYRMRHPVNTANLVELVTGGRSSQKRPHPVSEAENFCSFQQSFPVTLDGKPPNKLARSGAGFGEDRALYDRWRAQQFKMRETRLLAQWTRRPPTIAKVQRIIERQRWHSNCPSAEAIMTKWVPPHKEEVESSATLMKLVRTQKWKYLAVVEPSPKAGVGKGVVTTKTFPKNAIICDYHGTSSQAQKGGNGWPRRATRWATAFSSRPG
ncbi:hypothetical protein WMY93_008536 [Mugilogobius chulae]|uniref:Core-binding (CB) domain-containing protein n=1 Tax=Mugilogobius chulae TaxID=88201 RepID=A0AAW0PHE7_9GOBI